MFKHWADRLSLLLTANNIISSEKTEVYSYGMELFIFKGALYFIVIIISLLTQSFITSLIFVISYTLLRQYSGGYHCKTAGRCLIVSICIYAILILIFKFSFEQLDNILIALSWISIIPIIIFSPIESMNNPLTILEKKKYRVISIWLGIVFLTISTLLYYFDIDYAFYPISYTLTVDAVLIISAQRRNKNEKSTS